MNKWIMYKISCERKSYLEYNNKIALLIGKVVPFLVFKPMSCSGYKSFLGPHVLKGF